MKTVKKIYVIQFGSLKINSLLVSPQMDDPLKGGCCDKKIVKSFNAIIKHFPGLIFHLRIFQGQSVKREDSSVNKYQNLILLLLLIQKLNIFL